MNHEQIIRAWEDPIYRAALAPEILASLPTNPAGASMDEIEKAELNDVLASEPLLMSPKSKKHCGGGSILLCTVIGTVTVVGQCTCCN